MPHKVRRAVGVAGLGLGLVFALAPAASAASHGAYAYRSGNTSTGVLDAGDSNGVNLGGVGLTAPIIVCGNGVNVLGIGATGECKGVNGDDGGNAADGVLMGDDSNGVNLGGLAGTIPINVCGNGINVLGMFADGECKGVNG
jgi:hypothetical protein